MSKRINVRGSVHPGGVGAKKPLPDDEGFSSGADDSDEDVPTSALNVTTRKRTSMVRGGDDDEEEEEEEEEDDDDDDDDLELDPDTGEWKRRSSALKTEPFRPDILGVDSGTGFEDDTDNDDDANDDTDNDDDDDNGTEEEEGYFKKFDESLKHNIIEQFHPEMLLDNADEIDAMARVVRDEQGIIVDPLHQTVPFLTKYERAAILGKRAEQIEAGAPPMVHLDPSMIDAYLIAQLEMREKKIPFLVKRPLPNGKVEYWRLSDFEVL